MECFFISSALTLAVFCASDTCLDVHLCIRHLRNGDLWWCSATFVCVCIPWITNGVTQLSYMKTIRATKRTNPTIDTYNVILLVGAVLNLHPSTALICAAWFKWKGMNITAKKVRDNTTNLRLVENVFEAFPQSVLQIYILGQTNRFDFILIVSIATSLWSVSSGIFKGSFQLIERVEKFTTDYCKNDEILPRLSQLTEALLFNIPYTPTRAAMTRPPAEL